MKGKFYHLITIILKLLASEDNADEIVKQCTISARDISIPSSNKFLTFELNNHKLDIVLYDFKVPNKREETTREFDFISEVHKVGMFKYLWEKGQNEDLIKYFCDLLNKKQISSEYAKTKILKIEGIEFEWAPNRETPYTNVSSIGDFINKINQKFTLSSLLLDECNDQIKTVKNILVSLFYDEDNVKLVEGNDFLTLKDESKYGISGPCISIYLKFIKKDKITCKEYKFKTECLDLDNLNYLNTFCKTFSFKFSWKKSAIRILKKSRVLYYLVVELINGRGNKYFKMGEFENIFEPLSDEDYDSAKKAFEECREGDQTDFKKVTDRFMSSTFASSSLYAYLFLIFAGNFEYSNLASGFDDFSRVGCFKEAPYLFNEQVIKEVKKIIKYSRKRNINENVLRSYYENLFEIFEKIVCEKEILDNCRFFALLRIIFKIIIREEKIKKFLHGTDKACISITKMIFNTILTQEFFSKSFSTLTLCRKKCIEAETSSIVIVNK